MPEVIPYLLPEDIASATKCVFKLTFGENKEKYFVFKCLKLRPLVESFAAQIYREVVRPKKESMFFKAAAYYRKRRPGMMHVELISGVNLTGLEVLKIEHAALKKAANDPKNCLNTTFDNSIRQPSWISHADMTSFRELLKGKTPEDRLLKFDGYLTKFVKKEANKQKIIAYIKRNFM